MSLFGNTPEYRRKPDHVRAVMVLCGAVVFALCAAFVVFAAQYFNAKSMTLVSESVAAASVVEAVDKKNENPVQSVFAPNLVELLDLEADKAVETIGHGAVITDTSSALRANGTPYKKVTITLTGEPADQLTGTPTVYLALSDDGKVTEAGYQAGMRYLGYRSLSFTDAVDNAHVVERLLSEVGLSVEQGVVKAPEDKSAYANYGADGVTLESEVYEFSGTASLESDSYNWRSVVSYDYSYANVVSNMAYTIRTLSVYVSKA